MLDKQNAISLTYMQFEKGKKLYWDGWIYISSQHKFQLVKTIWSLKNLDNFRFLTDIHHETNNCLVRSTFFSISCHRKQHWGGTTHILIKICQMTQTLTLPNNKSLFFVSIRYLRKGRTLHRILPVSCLHELYIPWRNQRIFLPRLASADSSTQHMNQPSDSTWHFWAEEARSSYFYSVRVQHLNTKSFLWNPVKWTGFLKVVIVSSFLVAFAICAFQATYSLPYFQIYLYYTASVILLIYYLFFVIISAYRPELKSILKIC